MDAVMDLTARAVSFINLIQNIFLQHKVPVAEDNGAPVSSNLSCKIEDVFGDSFFLTFNGMVEDVKKRQKGCRYRRLSVPGQALEPGFDPTAAVRAEKRDSLDAGIGDTDNDFETRVEELVWISKKNPDKKDRREAESYTLELCGNLVNWVIENQYFITEKIGQYGAFEPPDVWREAISELIYGNTKQRIALAMALQYLPVHIVLAMGGAKYDAPEQRVLQWWLPKDQLEEPPTDLEEKPDSFLVLLTDKEQQLHKRFKKESYAYFLQENGSQELTEIDFYLRTIIEFLKDHKKLKSGLLKEAVPLNFEYVFNDELDEIATSRKLRKKELQLSEDKFYRHTAANLAEDDDGNGGEVINNCDPFVRAKQMKLFALALSGGGIRSATFNLGLLQGFAKSGMLSKIDYLSTVSGGGYIGSWLATWIKREGSVKKVADRLNTNKSANPMGEEVRPVRWLRMFSNYFAPDKSIMSVDSWTVGVTWLRNTLLNQVVIFSILFAILLSARLLWEFWKYKTTWTGTTAVPVVFIMSCVLLFMVAVLTGSGMQWYLGRQSKLPLQLHNNSRRNTFFILLIAIIGSFSVSATLYAHSEPTNFLEKIDALKYAGVWMLAILLFVAEYGKYHKCLLPYTRSIPLARATIAGTAFLSACLGLISLTLAWKVFELIKFKMGTKILNPDALAFSIGPAMVLLVFGVLAVSRMAFLGKYFPDERREWWGRMGATINKWAFIWMLIAGATLVAHDLLRYYLPKLNAPATVGGWMALVAATVKAAFSSKTSGNEEKKGFQAIALDILSIAGPYLFVLGLLIFLPQLIDPLMQKNIYPGFAKEPAAFKLFILFLMFAIIGIYLSWKLGVNEFSMHHFYRNRLVRAYLGATRRRDTRDKTSNSFTGFDKLDDEKLAQFTNSQGYYGPYPVLNTAVNATQISDLSRQDRKAESFIFSPLYCGFDFSRIRSSASPRFKSYDYGMRATSEYAYCDGGPAIGTAMAISGAAVNPNHGYHSSAGTAFLLTVFNVQMGWWMGNPRKSKWKEADPDFALPYVFNNLTGQSSTRDQFLCLSDGGHFDNMGLYEMVRRRCRFIIVGDAEQDENFTCEGFANAVRCCRIDFGAEIDIDISNIINRNKRHSTAHYAIGTIKYSGDKTANGTLVYIKSSITGDEEVDVTEYASKNVTFPHQTTADQFFDEKQFESYRKLGIHVAEKIIADQEVMLPLKLSMKGNERLWV